MRARSPHVVLALAVVAVLLNGTAGGATAHAASRAGAVHAPASVAPNAPRNMLDCNGWSRSYRPLRPGMKMTCADPVLTSREGAGGEYQRAQRFYDNGHYVGHDEPSIKFESNLGSSGDNLT